MICPDIGGECPIDKTYEYTSKMVSTVFPGWSSEAPKDPEMVLLNKMGKEGWILCGSRSYPTEILFYFVRKAA